MPASLVLKLGDRFTDAVRSGAHRHPPVTKSSGPIEGSKRVAADMKRNAAGPRGLWLEHDLVELEELAAVRHRRFAPEPATISDYFLSRHPAQNGT